MSTLTSAHNWSCNLKSHNVQNFCHSLSLNVLNFCWKMFNYTHFDNIHFSQWEIMFLGTLLLLLFSPHLLTPWCRVLHEQLTGLQLVIKFPAFHGTRMFITALTSIRQLSLSWASPIQPIYPHPTSWRSILILSTHLRLGLPIGLLPSSFPTKTVYTPLSSPIHATCPAQLILLHFIFSPLKEIKFTTMHMKLHNGEPF